MEHDPGGVSELSVGLGDVGVLGVDDKAGEPLRVHVRCRSARPPCSGCGGLLWSKGERRVVLVGLPVFGRPTRLVWHKRRWRCHQHGCVVLSVTERESQIAPRRALLSARAARWATRQAGRGEAVSDSAAALGCDRRTVNASARRWGQALLDADTKRVAQVSALGLDEPLFCRRGRFNKRGWSTSIVVAGRGHLLDAVPGRTAKAPARWLLARPSSWRAGVRWATLDPSGPYRAAFEAALPHTRQVADPFHVVRQG